MAKRKTEKVKLIYEQTCPVSGGCFANMTWSGEAKDERLPEEIGPAGKVLKSNGTSIEWGDGGGGGSDIHLYEHTIILGYMGAIGEDIAVTIYMQVRNNNGNAFANLAEFKQYLVDTYKNVALEGQVLLFSTGHTIDQNAQMGNPLLMNMLQYNEDLTEAEWIVSDPNFNMLTIDPSNTSAIQTFVDMVIQIL